MGHFSYTCQLSGLPITGGTSCVLLPILPKQHLYSAASENLQKIGVSSLVSNDGPNLYFNEFCFPIFGKYDDYGGLEDIEEDDNTKVLEKFFEMTIEEIVEKLLNKEFDADTSDDRAKLEKTVQTDKETFLTRTSMTWYRRDVYDNLVKKYKNGPKDWYDKLDLGVPGLLKYLGFTTTGKEEGKGRYNVPFTKDGLTIWSDGNWISNAKGDNNNMSVYNLLELQKWCKKKKVDIDISEFENVTRYYQIFKCLIPDMKKEDIRPHDRWVSERIIRMLLGDDDTLRSLSMSVDKLRDNLARSIKQREENPEKYKEVVDIMKMDTVEFYEGLIKDAEKDGPISTLPFLYFDMIKENGNEFLLKNIEDWFAFKSYFYPTGRFLYPVGTSSQDGDHEKVLQLLEVAVDCVKADLAERAKWDQDLDDDEDDEE